MFVNPFWLEKQLLSLWSCSCRGGGGDRPAGWACDEEEEEEEHHQIQSQPSSAEQCESEASPKISVGSDNAAVTHEKNPSPNYRTPNTANGSSPFSWHTGRDASCL